MDSVNYTTVIIAFASALIIVLLMNLGYMVRRMVRRYTRQTKQVQALFRIGTIVALRRELLLPLNSIEQGQSGVVQDVFDKPRLMAERQMFRRIMVVDFNGTLVPFDGTEARRYLVLEDS